MHASVVEVECIKRDVPALLVDASDLLHKRHEERLCDNRIIFRSTMKDEYVWIVAPNLMKRTGQEFVQSLELSSREDCGILQFAMLCVYRIDIVNSIIY